MSEHLPRKPRLLIVSDTSMWVKDGSLVAFEPVVREIENFYTLFERIVWIGYRRDTAKIDANTRAVSAVVPIEFVPLKAVGGTRLSDKLKILWAMPRYARLVRHYISRADVVHTRAPSLPAFFAICFSLLDHKRIYWHKYAGNWQEPNAPIFYALQRTLLQKARSTRVTINGKWNDQPAHLLSFENPCLTETELQRATAIGEAKRFDTAWTLAFVGNLTPNKGILELLEALRQLPPGANIERIIIAGDGHLRAEVEVLAKQLPMRVELRGYLQRAALESVYAAAHLLCLPSYSEGFPKVIAEGAAFGCVPVVSDISAIGQYVRHGENGFLLKTINAATITAALEEALAQGAHLKKHATEAMQMAQLFTYERFKQRIATEILNQPLI